MTLGRDLLTELQWQNQTIYSLKFKFIVYNLYIKIKYLYFQHSLPFSQF